MWVKRCTDGKEADSERVCVCVCLWGMEGGAPAARPLTILSRPALQDP